MLRFLKIFVGIRYFTILRNIIDEEEAKKRNYEGCNCMEKKHLELMKT